jgi:ribosomal protein S6
METNDLQEKKSKVYELGYLLAPSIAEEQVAGEVQNIKSVLDKFEAITITEDFPKLRPLAYMMAKTSRLARAISSIRLTLDGLNSKSVH